MNRFVKKIRNGLPFLMAFGLFSCGDAMTTSEVANDLLNPRPFVAVQNSPAGSLVYFSVPQGSTKVGFCEVSSLTPVSTCSTNAVQAQFRRQVGTRLILRAPQPITISAQKELILVYTTATGQVSQSKIRFVAGQQQNPQISSGTTTAGLGLLTTQGPTGEREENFTDSTSRSSKFKISVPADSSTQKPYGMLVYLHGDGAGDYSNYWSSLKRIAAKHNMIALSVLSPTQTQNKQWYREGSQNAEFLDQLIRSKLYRSYNIDTKNVVFTGASGGPQFLTGQFLPLKGNNYIGGAIPLCGGGGPQGFGSTARSFQPNANFKNYFKMFYYTQQGDFLHDQAADSASHYKSLGVTNVQSEFPAGGSHCGFNVTAKIDEKLPSVLK